MKIVGSMLFYASHKKEELAKSRYKSVPTDFSGYVLFYDWSEKLLYGYRYQVGDITGTCSPASTPNGRLTTCNTTPVDHYSQTYIEGYGYGPRIYMYTDYVTTCYDSGNGGGTGPSGPVSGGGGVSSGGNIAIKDANGAYYISVYDKPTTDINKIMNCFGGNQLIDSDKYNFIITVCVQEPNSLGGGDSYGFDNGPGHVFLGLTKTNKSNPSDKVNQIFGFYPTLSPLSSMIYVPSQIKDNGGTNYTVRKTFNVNAYQFANAIDMAKGMSDVMYKLDGFNCTSYVLTICDAADLGIPHNQQFIGTGNAYTPGRLGADLRSLSGSDSSIKVGASKSARSTGECDY